MLSLNGRVRLGAASTVSPHTDGTSRYHYWRNEFDSWAPPRHSLFRRFPTLEIPLETSAMCFSFKSILLRSKSDFLFQQLQQHESKFSRLAQNKSWEIAAGCFLFFFFSSFKAAVGETGGGFASQEHTFLQMPFSSYFTLHKLNIFCQAIWLPCEIELLMWKLYVQAGVSDPLVFVFF